MARVTVEDCVVKIPNRFDLVLVAAGRAKSLGAGAPETVARDNDKNTVIALREIEEGTIDTNLVRENLIAGMQKYATMKEIGPDNDHIKEVEAGVRAARPLNNPGFIFSQHQGWLMVFLNDLVGYQSHNPFMPRRVIMGQGRLILVTHLFDLGISLVYGLLSQVFSFGIQLFHLVSQFLGFAWAFS